MLRVSELEGKGSTRGRGGERHLDAGAGVGVGGWAGMEKRGTSGSGAAAANEKLPGPFPECDTATFGASAGASGAMHDTKRAVRTSSALFT